MPEVKGTDFVLLCEFSEKDGPVPRELLGTPVSGFPLDQFAVKLMSVEMKMEVGEKWSAWCEWKAQGVEYLVVHFQLHDLDARGYSRQLVFAYVSYHPKKLVKHRSIYLEALHYAANMMMEANEMDWKFELHKRIQSLKDVYLYIKMDQFQQRSTLQHTNSASPSHDQPPSSAITDPQKSKTKRKKLEKPSAIKTFETSEDLPFPSPKTLETSYLELIKLQRQIKGGGKLFPNEKKPSLPLKPSTPTSERAEASFEAFFQAKINLANSELEETTGMDLDELNPSTPVPAPASKSLTSSSRKLSKRKNSLRDFYLPWKLEMKNKLKNGYALFSIVEPTQEQLGLVYSLHYKNTLYDKSLRSVWQLCPPALTRSLSLLRGLLDGFSHSSVVLDHILAEHKQLLRSPASLLAIGEVPIVNFDLDAINASTPTPSSLRWLAQSKVSAPVSLSGLELGGLDAIHMSKGSRKDLQFSFTSIPRYLGSYSRSNHPSSIFSAESLTGEATAPISPRGEFPSVSPRQPFPQTPSYDQPASTNSTQHPLGVLAESVGLSRLGMRNELLAASSPTSGASYISPGAPLISELAMATSNAYLAHRLDYLAADLTSISTLLWPSSTVPSAYFPSGSTFASYSTKTSPQTTGLSYDPNFAKNVGLASSNGAYQADPAVANLDFGSFLGLGTAASSAALASGALSLPLATSPSPQSSTQNLANYASGGAAHRADSSLRHWMRYVPTTAPSTFTSCIACKHAAVDSLLVQLQHDAICIKSGEDEATHIWNVKWRGLVRSRTNAISPSPSTLIHAPSTDAIKTKREDSREEGVAENSNLQPTNQTPNSDIHRNDETSAAKEVRESAQTSSNLSTQKVDGHDTQLHTTLLASPEPVHKVSPKVLEPIRDAPSTRSTNNPTFTSLSASASPALSTPPMSTSSSPAPSSSKKTSSQASNTSNTRKSQSFASMGSSGTGTSSKETSNVPAAIPAVIPVSDMNLLHLRNRFSFLRHVIFSLLKGRPVVIHAEARNRPWVEQVVASLACFVPGHHLSGDSVAQTLFQLDPARSKASTTPQYIPRQSQTVKVIHWRDARDVIFESIHHQSPSGSSTKSRLKHTKLVITRFLQLHLQKMQRYSTFAKQDAPDAAVSALPNQMSERNLSEKSVSSTVSSPALADANTSEVPKLFSSSPAASSVTMGPQHNIPTLSVASRQAIKLSQLSHLKLLGLDKSCPIPKTVERYITYWDWEAEELTCVAYEKGKLLDAMINPKKQWPDEASYRAHIHFHLSELATRAWMYYHMCCIGLFVGGVTPPNALAVSQVHIPYQLPPHQTQISPASGTQSPGITHTASQWSLGTQPLNPMDGATTTTGSNANNAKNPPTDTSSASFATFGTLPPSTPKKAATSPATYGNTSPNSVALDLGFEPPNFRNSGLLSPGTSSAHSATGKETKSTSNKPLAASTSLMGPSLSTAPTFEIASPAPSLAASTPRLVRDSSYGSLTATSPFKGTPSASGRGNRSSTISNAADPRFTLPSLSGSSTSGINQNGTNTGPTPADYAFQAQMLQQRTKTAYFQSLKLLEHDCDIIEYLAEVIKMQQAQEVKGQSQTFQSFTNLQVNDLIALALHNKSREPMPASPAPSPFPTPTSSNIKLDYAPTRKFKNMQLN